MAHMPKTRGSVLLMVVGLLTMIAMLGGTFVVIAYLDAKSTTAMVAKVQADPLAKGLATQAIAMLAEKLDIENDAKGPYSSNSSVKPEFALHGSDQLGPYLYFYDPDANPVIHHPSAFDGAGAAADEINIDNDPGGIKDGYLHKSKTMNADGDMYWYAVAVRDLGGLLCVNTAGNKTEMLDPVSPVNIDLFNALSAIHPDGGTYYSKVHSARCGTGGGSMQNLHDNLAIRLLNPQGGTKPFDIGDELYLRWLKTPSITESGRLYEAMKSFSARQYLTTCSIARSLVRHPSKEATYEYLKRIKMSGTCLDVDGLREYLLGQLMMARTGGQGGGSGGDTAGDEIIVDDGDSECVLTGSWSTYSYSASEGGDFHQTASAGSARYTFTIPQAGSDCDVYFTWISNAKRNPDLPWAIYDGSNPTAVATGTVNQHNAPSGTGLPPWESLKKVTITSTTCIVEFKFDSANQYVLMDAVKVVPYPPVSQAPPSGGPEPAHFLANLWASLKTPAEAAGNAFKVTYPDTASGGNKSVYGITNQPFIVETYAQHETNDKEGDEYDGKYHVGFAMRLMNPSKTHPISLANYKIKGCPGGDLDLSAVGSIPAATGTAGGSVVLYDVDGGTNWTEDLTEFGFGGANWHRVTGLRLWKSTTPIRLVRVVGTEVIPIDSVLVGASDDLKYEAVENDLKSPPDDKLKEKVKKGARRDDRLTGAGGVGGRYSVAIHHHTSGEAHNLNGGTNVGVAEIPLATLGYGYHVEIPHAGDWAKSPAELAKIYQVGPTADGGDLPHILAELTAKMKESRGRANFLGDAPPGPTAYPDVPWATLVGEIFEFAQTDTSRPADDPHGTRVYGHVNINTAPTRVLRYLPWPTGIKVADAIDGSETTFLAAIDVNTIVQYIVNYRENTGTHNRASMGVSQLRTGTNYGGYMTPAELAIPLAKYFDNTVAASLKNHKLYMEARDKLYGAVSNVISVNSDVFAINILVQLGNPAKYTWYYLAIVDRSNCRKKEDRPVVLLFSQLF